MVFDVAIIGTGSDPANTDAGYSMGYKHASGYQRLDRCSLTSCADIDRDNAEQFADEFGIPNDRIFQDHEELLVECDPDIVSICTPPTFHASIVEYVAIHGSVQAIHCEKPMAHTWGKCLEMVDTCESEGVALTFNHQRRFGKPFTRAKDLLESGRIGALKRIEMGGKNLFDYGTHLFDLCGFYTDQSPVDWVLAAIDYREEDIQYGVHHENQAVAQWKYEDNVWGVASTGPQSFVTCQMRLIGDEGVIDIGVENGPPVRVKSVDDPTWSTIDTNRDGFHNHRDGVQDAAFRRLERVLPLMNAGMISTPMYTDRAIASVVQAVTDGRPSPLNAQNALDATELIFASWESARRGERVDLPLEIDDNPLESMVESGQVRPEPN